MLIGIVGYVYGYIKILLEIQRNIYEQLNVRLIVLIGTIKQVFNRRERYILILLEK